MDSRCSKETREHGGRSQGVNLGLELMILAPGPFYMPHRQVAQAVRTARIESESLLQACLGHPKTCHQVQGFLSMGNLSRLF